MTLEELSKRLAPFTHPYDLTGECRWLDTLAREARAIAVGEGTHGSTEFFQNQRDISKYLIEHHRARLILLELPGTPGIEMNRRLATDASGIRAAIERFPFETWNNEPIAELLEFVRRWNRAHPHDRVVLRGIDPQPPEAIVWLRCLVPGPEPRALSLAEWCNEASAVIDTVHSLEAQGSSTRQHRSRILSGGRSPSSSEQRPLFDVVQRGLALSDVFTDNPLIGDLIRTTCRNLAYRIRCLPYSPVVRLEVRDRSMAAGIIRAIRELSPDDRAIVLAHNAHVALGSPDLFARGMGHFVRRGIGETGYRAIGATTGGGTVTSRLRVDSDQRAVYPSDPPPAYSLEYILQGVTATPVYVDIADASRSDPMLNSLFRRRTVMRSMGSLLLKNEFCPVRPVSQFDGLVYFPKTHGSAAPTISTE